MLKKAIVLLSALFFSAAYADTCPSVIEIKQDNFHGWEALNTDSGEPVSALKLKKFKRLVKAFNFAYWVENAPEGSGQCYYRQVDEVAEVYFAKNTLAPLEAEGNWYKAAWGFLKCEVGLVACRLPE